MVRIIGLDLSWTGRRESGICVLDIDPETDQLQVRELAARVLTIGDAVALAAAEANAVMAVDAPLLRRDGCMAERELGRVFGRYGAGAYLATTDFLERKGLAAGLRLGDALAAAGFQLDPRLVRARAGGRLAFEMYPHAFHVSLFGLERILKYKKGRLSDRASGLDDYAARLRAHLAVNEPALLPVPAIAEALEPHAGVVSGRALKLWEDTLDGLSCALAGLLAWRDGVEPWQVFGSPVEAGYIAVPGWTPRA